MNGYLAFTCVNFIWSAHLSRNSRHRFFSSLCLPTGLINFFHFLRDAKLNLHLIKFQIYCRLPSDRFATFPNSAGIENRFDHCVVHIGDSDAADNSLFNDRAADGWEKVVQYCVAFGKFRKWKHNNGRWRLHRVGWLDFHIVHLHVGIRDSLKLDSDFLLSRLAKAANRRTQIEVEREEAIASQSYQTCLNCHRCLRPLLDALLGESRNLSLNIHRTPREAIAEHHGKEIQKKYDINTPVEMKNILMEIDKAKWPKGFPWDFSFFRYRNLHLVIVWIAIFHSRCQLILQTNSIWFRGPRWSTICGSSNLIESLINEFIFWYFL